MKYKISTIRNQEGAIQTINIYSKENKILDNIINQYKKINENLLSKNKTLEGVDIEFELK